MLNDKGQLTDISNWYLGGNATGVKPEGSGSAMASPQVFLLFSVFLARLLAVLFLSW
jgi:hypothetical protein